MYIGQEEKKERLTRPGRPAGPNNGRLARPGTGKTSKTGNNGGRNSMNNGRKSVGERRWGSAAGNTGRTAVEKIQERWQKQRQERPAETAVGTVAEKVSGTGTGVEQLPERWQKLW